MNQRVDTNVMFHRTSLGTCICCSCRVRDRREGGIWAVYFWDELEHFGRPEIYCQSCYLFMHDTCLRRHGFPSPHLKVRLNDPKDPCYAWYREKIVGVAAKKNLNLDSAGELEFWYPVGMRQTARTPSRLLACDYPRLRPLWPANEQELPQFRKFNRALRGGD